MGIFTLGPFFPLSGVSAYRYQSGSPCSASHPHWPDSGSGCHTLGFLSHSKTSQSLGAAVRREVSKAPLTSAGILEQAATSFEGKWCHIMPDEHIFVTQLVFFMQHMHVFLSKNYSGFSCRTLYLSCFERFSIKIHSPIPAPSFCAFSSHPTPLQYYRNFQFGFFQLLSDVFGCRSSSKT